MISLARCSEPLWQRLLSQEDLRVSFLTTFTADQLKDLSHASYTAYVIKTNLELIAGISLWLSPSVEDKFSIVPLSKHLSLIRECLKLPSTGVDFGAIYSDLSRLLVESQPPNAWKLIAFEAAGAYNFQRSWDALVEPQLAEADRTGRTFHSLPFVISLTPCRFNMDVDESGRARDPPRALRLPHLLHAHSRSLPGLAQHLRPPARATGPPLGACNDCLLFDCHNRPPTSR